MSLNIFPWRSLKVRLTVSILVIFLISIWTLFFYISWKLHNDMVHLLGEHQVAMATYMATEVNRELENRMKTLELIGDKIDSTLLNQKARLHNFIRERNVLLHQFNKGVAVYQLDELVGYGSNNPKQLEFDFRDDEILNSALKEGKPMIGHPSFNKSNSAPIFGIAVPIFDSHKKPIGVIVGVTDLSYPNFIDHLTESRYGQTGFYLLEDGKKRIIITGSDKSRLMEKLPPIGVNPIIDRHAQGFDETNLVTNPHGIEVLGSVKHLSVVDWFVVVSMPTSEAFAPIRGMKQEMLFATILLSLVVGSFTWWTVRQQLYPILNTVKILSNVTETTEPISHITITKKDEVGELINSFNHLLEILSKGGEDLRKSKLQYDKLVSRIPIGIYLLHSTSDGNFFFDYVSPTMAQILDSTPEKIKADVQLAFKPIHPEELDAFIKLNEDSIKNTKRFDWEGRFLFNGKLSWLNISSSPEIIENGDVLWHGILVDVTDRKLAEAKLIESETRLRTIIENEPECIKIIDQDGNLRQMNLAGLKMLEANTIEEVLGNKFLSFIIPEYHHSFMELHKQVISGETKQMEFEIIGQKGGHRWLETNAVPFFDNGETMLLSVTRDITGRKQSEKIINELNRDFVSFLENTRDFIYYKDKSSRIRFCSQIMAVITGHKSWREMIGKHDLEIFPKDVAQIYYEEELPIFQEGKPLLNKIDPYYDAYGNKKWVNTNKWPLFDSNGGVEGIFGISRDITELVKADEARRIAATAFESQEGMVVTDSNNVILRVNRAFSEMTGYDPEEMIGKKMKLLKSNRHSREFYEAMWFGILHNGVWQGEIWNKVKNGEVHPHWVTISVVKDINGSITHFVGSYSDITNRKKAEEALRESEERFRHFFEKNSLVMMLTLPATGEIIDINSAGAAFYGYPREKIIGMSTSAINLLSPEKIKEKRQLALKEERNFFIVQHRLASGEVRDVEVHITKIESGGRYIFFSIVHDITERKRLEEKLKEISIRDPLTNIFNRRYILERLDKIFAEYVRDLTIFSILIIDIDHFKNVNDTYGHLGGDFILTEFSAMIQTNLRPYDLLGRYGGEEFIVVFIKVNKDQIKSKVNGLLEMVRNKIFLFKEVEIRITFSGGISDSSEYDKTSVSIEKIIEGADNRLYSAKRTGRNKILNSDEIS